MQTLTYVVVIRVANAIHFIIMNYNTATTQVCVCVLRTYIIIITSTHTCIHYITQSNTLHAQFLLVHLFWRRPQLTFETRVMYFVCELCSRRPSCNFRRFTHHQHEHNLLCILLCVYVYKSTVLINIIIYVFVTFLNDMTRINSLRVPQVDHDASVVASRVAVAAVTRIDRRGH